MAETGEIPRISDEERWFALYRKKLELELVACFTRFRKCGLEPILIKGWAAARNYPPGVPRNYTDIDLAFSSDDFDKAWQMMRSDPNFRFGVDLHRELRHLDSVPWLQIFANSLLVPLHDCAIRVPSAEDHLRILATHWLNDGGERKEKLWDIYFAVKNRDPGFDWDKCLGSVSANRKQWVVMAVGAAHRYLGLDIDDLPFAGQARELPAWFTRRLEKEWNSERRLRPLSVVAGNPREFAAQIFKRFPPNPIQATIEMDGDLRSGKRFIYQLGSVRKRLVPSVANLKQRFRKRPE